MLICINLLIYQVAKEPRNVEFFFIFSTSLGGTKNGCGIRIGIFHRHTFGHLWSLLVPHSFKGMLFTVSGLSTTARMSKYGALPCKC